VRTLALRSLVLALLAGCSTNPVTGRDQIVAVPAAQAHADIGFALSNGARRISLAAPCGQACPDEDRLARFALQAALVTAELENAARGLSPEAMSRIESFLVRVEPELGFATGSSASGRIALGSAIARLEPADDVIAFLVAREMAHVIARHDEEDSGARIFSSALTTFIPGFSLVARFLASTLGGGALTRSWAAEQRREADEIAVALLERAGRPAATVAESLATGLRLDRLPEGEWATRYAESAARVAALAELPPRYADAGD
jgi:Zn-dependent protease with chaperone function